MSFFVGESSILLRFERLNKLEIVTVVAIALFVALIVAIRKLYDEKTHLCWTIRDVF